jgi:hypothetical protein
MDPFSGRLPNLLTERANQGHRRWMNELVGHARASTGQQDLTAQCNGLRLTRRRYRWEQLLFEGNERSFDDCRSTL